METYHLANPLQHGDDLKPLQTALKKDKFYGGAIDGIFGAGTGHACAVAKYHLGYPKKKCLPVGGQDLLNLLDGTWKLPTLYLIRRHLRGFGISKATRQRALLVAYALWSYENGGELHYAEIRPMENMNNLKALPDTEDCSTFVTRAYKFAGLPDPNGFGFNGLGYTGTMLDHGTTIPLSQAKAGDVVIWGWFPGHHTAILVEDGTANGGDPTIVSQGGEVGPQKELLSNESAAQASWGVTNYVIKRYIND